MGEDGILLAAERKSTNKLLDEVFHSEKIYTINDNTACTVAGITSDANLLTQELRLIGQRYYYSKQQLMPCEQLVSQLCDIKQAYTQYGGKRPFGVSLLYMGWKATCIGNNSNAAISQLKQEYKEGEMSLNDALDLAVKVLSKTLDSTKLTPEKIEIATLKRVNGKTKIEILKGDEMEALIKKYEDAEKAAEEAKKEK